MLKRTTTVSASSKQEIQEELDMYSPYQKFISQNPDVERIAKQKEIEGKTEGKIESKVDSILNILDIRFSNDMLIDLAKQALGHIHDIEILGKLEREALQSPDEQDVHRWLGKYLSQNEKESNREGGEE
jgi:hypothetical protein